MPSLRFDILFQSEPAAAVGKERNYFLLDCSYNLRVVVLSLGIFLATLVPTLQLNDKLCQNLIIALITCGYAFQLLSSSKELSDPSCRFSQMLR